MKNHCLLKKKKRKTVKTISFSLICSVHKFLTRRIDSTYFDAFQFVSNKSDVIAWDSFLMRAIPWSFSAFCLRGWLNQISQASRPIRSTTQIWVVTSHQYGISALVSQTSFGEEASGGVAKYRLFSQSLTNSRGSQVAGRGSRVAGRGSRVAGPKSRSRVQCRGRGSKVAVAGPMSRQGKMIWGSR